MSPFYYELGRPGEDGIGLTVEDFRAIADGAGVRRIACHLGDGERCQVTADQATAIAEAIGQHKRTDWTEEMAAGLMAFLRGGAFTVQRVAC